MFKLAVAGAGRGLRSAGGGGGGDEDRGNLSRGRGFAVFAKPEAIQSESNRGMEDHDPTSIQRQICLNIEI